MSVTKPWSDRAFDEALKEIARLPMLERRLFCKAAFIYFASCRGYTVMSKLGELPDSHPRILLARQRMVHDLFLLLKCGALSSEVSALVLEREADRLE